MNTIDKLKELEDKIKDINLRLTEIRRIAGSFLGLADTPTSYVGEGGEFCKVKVTENGIEFGGGDGGISDSLGRLDINEIFDELVTGNIAGQGSYTGWGTWQVSAAANTSAQVVVKSGADKMLRLERTAGSGAVSAYLDWNDADNNWGLSAGYFMRFKVRKKTINSGRGNIFFMTGGTKRYQLYFRESSYFCFYYEGGSVQNLWVPINDTWYDVAVLLTSPANRYVNIYKDGDFNKIVADGSKNCYNINRIKFELYQGPSEEYFDIDDLKLWTLRNASI